MLDQTGVLFWVTQYIWGSVHRLTVHCHINDSETSYNESSGQTKRLRQHLHGTGSVWNQYKTGTDKPCVYKGPGGIRYGSDLLSGTKWVHLRR